MIEQRNSKHFRHSNALDGVIDFLKRQSGSVAEVIIEGKKKQFHKVTILVCAAVHGMVFKPSSLKQGV